MLLLPLFLPFSLSMCVWHRQQRSAPSYVSHSRREKKHEAVTCRGGISSAMFVVPST